MRTKYNTYNWYGNEQESAYGHIHSDQHQRAVANVLASEERDKKDGKKRKRSTSMKSGRSGRRKVKNTNLTFA